jgi:2-polyprenyl-3-methyl-5-hydroxy-6-metoxy-1,4-benzoquinol methylase
MLSTPASGPVLDIGCGQGEIARLLVRDGYDAHGVDISPEQVALARAAGVDRVQQGDFRAILQMGPEQLAAVTAMNVLEHWHQR